MSVIQFPFVSIRKKLQYCKSKKVFKVIYCATEPEDWLDSYDVVQYRNYACTPLMSLVQSIS